MVEREVIETPFGDKITVRKDTKPGDVVRTTLIHYLKSGWLFNKWYEKVILALAFWWSIYSIITWLI